MKFNLKEAKQEYDDIIATKIVPEIKKEAIGNEIVSWLKRLPVNKQSLDLLRFLKQKYESK